VTFYPVHVGGTPHGALVASGGLFLGKQSPACEQVITGKAWNKTTDGCPRNGQLCRVVIEANHGWQHVIMAEPVQ
jgi:hypothetical protein